MSSFVPAPYDPSAAPLPSPIGPPQPTFAAPPPPPAPPAEDEGPGLDIRRLVAAVLRYKWLVAVCAVVGLLVGVALTRVQRPTYQAQATIWVQVASDRNGPIQQGQLLQSTAWLDLLTSFVVLDAVVREQRLFLALASPEDSTAMVAFDLKDRFQPGNYRVTVDPAGRNVILAVKGGLEVQRAAVGDSIGSAIGFLWAPGPDVLKAGRVIEFTVNTPRDAAVTLANHLRANIPQRDGNFIRLSLTGTIPSQTAATLNAVTEHFVAVAATLKKEKLSQLSLILSEQLRSAYSDLQRSETELEGFRVSTITLPSDPSTPIAGGIAITRDPVYNAFLELKVQREALRRDREAIERVLARNDTSIAPVMLQGIASVQAATELKRALDELTAQLAELRALRTRFTELSPQVQRATADVATLQRQTVPGLLRDLATQIRTQEADLDGRVEGESRSLRDIPQRTINEARLQRNVRIAENLYTTLQSRYEEARLGEASTVPDVRILDRAVTPQVPVTNLAIILMVGGLAGGFGLAIGVAILLDRFDRRIRYPDQVTRDMGLQILGTLPRLKASPAGMRGDDAAQMVEALRTIRLNLSHAYGTAGPIILTVTSPGSGDGKSFLASNLALTFADAGQKTLLIDGDIRRGALHRVLNANRKPGLIDYLNGAMPKDAIIQSTRVPMVDFIGCGTRKLGGPELLASQAMSQLLIGLRTSYAAIIIDCAPLGAGVDPLVLGSLTGNVLLVLRTGVTDREYAAAKMENIERLPIRVLGAVLNDVRPEGLYRYYSYLPGYASEDEKDEAGAVKQIAGS